MEIDADKRFPEFKRIEDSPRFEIISSSAARERRCHHFARLLRLFKLPGINVHRIVDFARCRKEAVDGKTRVSRVATVTSQVRTPHSSWRTEFAVCPVS